MLMGTERYYSRWIQETSEDQVGRPHLWIAMAILTHMTRNINAILEWRKA